MCKDNLSFDDFKTKVKNYYKKEQEFLEPLQIRWGDECEYEDAQEYKNLIMNRAKKLNVNATSVYLNPYSYLYLILYNYDNIKFYLIWILNFVTYL